MTAEITWTFWPGLILGLIVGAAATAYLIYRAHPHE